MRLYRERQKMREKSEKKRRNRLIANATFPSRSFCNVSLSLSLSLSLSHRNYEFTPRTRRDEGRMREDQMIIITQVKME